jgi:hypothetical protein
MTPQRIATIQMEIVQTKKEGVLYDFLSSNAGAGRLSSQDVGRHQLGVAPMK